MAGGVNLSKTAMKKEPAVSQDTWDGLIGTGVPDIPTPTVGEWDSLIEEQQIEYSGVEKATTVGRGATGAAVELAPAAGGAVMGGSIGALGGPAAPVTIPVGALVGTAAGYLAGHQMRRQLSRVELPGGTPLTFESAADLPPGLRPYGYAGEALGGGAPFAGVPLAAARVGAQLPATRIGKFFQRIIDTAGRHPGKFAGAEISGLAGSGAAGGISEAYAPGETGKRVLAEIAGGFFNPSRVILSAAGGAVDSVRKVTQTFTKAGKEAIASKWLKELVNAAGENPADIIKAIRASGMPGMELTVAQKTGSPAMIAFEAQLIKQSARFGADAEKSAKDGLLVISNMIEALSRTGKPAALQEAAKLRATYFRILLSQNVSTARKTAVEAAKKITSDTPQARAELSKQAHEIMSESLEGARGVEKQLWGFVDQKLPSTADSVVEAHAVLKGQLLPEEVLPDVIEGFVERVGKEGTTSGELLRFRSRMLALARDAAGQKKWDQARILGEMAESALDDLSKAGADDALELARTYSRELNDVFSRTFVGDALAKAATGARRIPPELMLRRALATGKEATALKFRELDEAARFLASQGVGGETAMMEIQERFLRLAVSEAINPNTGRITAARLGKVMSDNAELLDRFPNMKADIEKALTSETALKSYEEMVTKAEGIIAKQSIFARIMKIGNPVEAVSKSLKGATPVKDLEDMIKLAKHGDALEGLKSSIYDHAVREATDAKGNISFAKFRKALFDPLEADAPSVIETLTNRGVVSGDDVTRLEAMFDEAAKIESAAERSADVKAFMEHAEAVIGDPDAITDLILRIAGAKFGAKLATGTSGATLVAAGRGSSFVRMLFNKIPKERMRDVLIEAATNPEFMAMLLEKPTTPQEGIRLGRQIHAYLFQAGITATED